MPNRTEVFRSIRSSRTTIEILWVALAGVCGAVVVIWTLHLWSIHPYVPFIRGGDADYTMALLKNLDRHGWYFSTNRLGAPFSQDLRDFPDAGDSLNLLVAKGVGLVTDSPALMMNLFFFASYPLIAMTSFVGSRLIGLRRPTSLVVGIVYTAMPYHLYRYAHLFLASYFVLPLAAALVIRQAGPRPLLRRRAGARWHGYLHRDFVVGVAIVVAAAGCGVYYAAFTCIFLVAAALLALSRGRRRSAVMSGLALFAIGLVLALQLVPSVLYEHENGENSIATRTLSELDTYPLRPSVMLLPVPGHQISVVRDWRDAIAPPTITSEGPSEALGTFGTIGFVLCLGTVIAQFGGRRRRRELARVVDAPVFLLFGLLFAVYSGFEMVLGVTLGLTQLRAWNRMSIFLAFFCVVMAAAWLSRALRGRRRVAVVLMPLICVLAIWDQTPVTAVPDYAANARSWANDSNFFQRIEATLPAGASVFQLPVVDFPEVPGVGAMPDYAQVAGYLHTEGLKWSYGGVKGREADWRLRLDPKEAGFIDDLLVTGFTGLTVNLAAYPDNGATLDATLQADGITPAFESPNGDVRFYDLRSALQTIDARMTPAQQAQRSKTLLDQPEVKFGTGFYPSEGVTARRFRWAQSSSQFTLQGDVPDLGPSVLRLHVSTAAPGNSDLNVTVQGTTQHFTISQSLSNVDVAVNLSGDPVIVTLNSDAPDDGAIDLRTLVVYVDELPTVLFDQAG